METNLLHELEFAEALLSDDLQQLSYISEEFAVKEGEYVDIPFIKNSLETLFKSMCFNRDKIKKVIDQEYEKKKGEKEDVKSIPVNK